MCVLSACMLNLAVSVCQDAQLTALMVLGGRTSVRTKLITDRHIYTKHRTLENQTQINYIVSKIH